VDKWTNNPRGAAAYRQVDAHSRSPIELTLMLYDGIIRFLGEAQQAIARKDAAASGAAVSRALAIVGELQNTLNLKDGGAIAAELDRLYTYINSRLLAVTAQRDAGALKEVLALVTTLRDGWIEAAKNPAAAAKR
jgi:flagellar protein FliS